MVLDPTGELRPEQQPARRGPFSRYVLIRMGVLSEDLDRPDLLRLPTRSRSPPNVFFCPTSISTQSITVIPIFCMGLKSWRHLIVRQWQPPAGLQVPYRIVFELLLGLLNFYLHLPWTRSGF